MNFLKKNIYDKNLSIYDIIVYKFPNDTLSKNVRDDF